MMLFVVFFLWLLNDDWFQWGGPERDFSTSLRVEAIRKDKPLDQLWKIEVGEGYSGLVQSGNRLFVHSRLEDEETVTAVDIVNGRKLWSHVYLAPALDHMIPRYGFGPHSTPCVADGKVVSVGGTGVLSVLDVESGEVLWTRNIWTEYDATQVERGYAASPLVHSGKVILPVGGEGSGVVAFDLGSGKEVWKSTSFKASYASPLIKKLNGVEQLICLMDQELISLDPASGKLLWQFDYPTYKTVHVASPIVLPDDRVFFLSSNKATMLRVVKDAQGLMASRIWESRYMTPQVGNVIRVGDQLIGPDGNMNALMTGVSLGSGGRLWKSRISNAGFYYRTEDGFVSISDRGEVSFNLLVGGKPVARSTFTTDLSGRIWNTAAITQNRLFVRDEDSVRAFAIRYAIPARR